MDKGESATPVIGLTGGIAAGKSTVSERLGTLGAHVIDADRVGHRVLMRERGEAYEGVVAAFRNGDPRTSRGRSRALASGGWSSPIRRGSPSSTA